MCANNSAAKIVVVGVLRLFLFFPRLFPSLFPATTHYTSTQKVAIPSLTHIHSLPTHTTVACMTTRRRRRGRHSHSLGAPRTSISSLLLDPVPVCVVCSILLLSVLQHSLSLSSFPLFACGPLVLLLDRDRRERDSRVLRAHSQCTPMVQRHTHTRSIGGHDKTSPAPALSFRWPASNRLFAHTQSLAQPSSSSSGRGAAAAIFLLAPDLTRSDAQQFLSLMQVLDLSHPLLPESSKNRYLPLVSFFLAAFSPG